MIKAVIVDDEKHARNMLRNLLKKYCSETVELVGEASNAEDGVTLISDTQPDLVFLDIQMPGGSGFDLLSQFDELNFEVIFTTAYDKYAITAFKFSAFGYLLKPIEIQELKSLLEKLQNHLELLKKQTGKRMKVLIENYGDDRKVNKLVITNMSGFVVLNMENIVRLEADQSYTDFIMSDGKKITSSKKIGAYETLLNDFGFHRVHQSSMINLRHVISYEKGDGGTIEMSDGSHVSLSRRRKPGFIKRFI